MDQYKLVSVGNFREALEVRVIRNQCRMFMTGDTALITTAKQREWYFGNYKPENKKGNELCFLFKANKKSIGFGYIRNIEKRYWITIGLSSAHRGRGLGKILLTKLLESVPSCEVWLDVLDTNKVAKKLYQLKGFKKVKEKAVGGKKVIVMKLLKK